MVRAPHTHTIISSPATALPTVGACCEMGTAAASQSPESSPSEGVYLECGERSRRDLSVSGRFPCANLEGYRVNVVVIFTRCGAPFSFSLNDNVQRRPRDSMTMSGAILIQ